MPEKQPVPFTAFDPRGTRYEIVGTTNNDRRVAVICRFKSTGKLLLITTYES
jgi:hypothetical protein